MPWRPKYTVLQPWSELSCQRTFSNTTSACALTANKRRELPIDRFAFTNRSIDKVKHVGVGIVDEQVGGLGSVHRTTTSDSEEMGDLLVSREIDRFLHQSTSAVLIR